MISLTTLPLVRFATLSELFIKYARPILVNNFMDVRRQVIPPFYKDASGTNFLHQDWNPDDWYPSHGNDLLQHKGGKIGSIFKTKKCLS